MLNDYCTQSPDLLGKNQFCITCSGKLLGINPLKCQLGKNKKSISSQQDIGGDETPVLLGRKLAGLISYLLGQEVGWPDFLFTWAGSWLARLFTWAGTLRCPTARVPSMGRPWAGPRCGRDLGEGGCTAAQV